MKKGGGEGGELARASVEEARKKGIEKSATVLIGGEVSLVSPFTWARRRVREAPMS